MLAEEEKDTLPHLLTSFTRRYNNVDHTGFFQTSLLWKLRQGKDESAVDFMDNVEHACLKVGYPANQIDKIVLNGLRPEIRKHIIPGRARNLTQLRELALRAETVMSSVEERELFENIQEISAMIKRLQTAMTQARDNTEEKPNIEYTQSNRGESWNNKTHVLREYFQCRCTRCGFWATNKHRCPAINKNCYHCQKNGHFRRCCWSRYRKRIEGPALRMVNTTSRSGQISSEQDQS